MTNETLRERLLAHADAHAAVTPYDDEQAQWERDLREAAQSLAATPAALYGATACGLAVIAPRLNPAIALQVDRR